MSIFKENCAMICSNCNKLNDTDSNFCKYCGDNLKPDASDPHHSIFETRSQPARVNNELGYLLIALLIALNILFWIVAPWILSSSGESDNPFRVVRIFSMFFLIAQFVIMFIYARRNSYRIIIGAIAALVLLSYAFTLFNILRS